MLKLAAYESLLCVTLIYRRSSATSVPMGVGSFPGIQGGGYETSFRNRHSDVAGADAVWISTGSAANHAAPAASSNSATTITSSQSSAPSVADSQVRIVRLSDATGEVQMDRNTGRGFEPALLNLPVTQGVRLRTGAGFAEVEFEDNSTLRLTPNTIVEFPQLQLRSIRRHGFHCERRDRHGLREPRAHQGQRVHADLRNQKILLAPSSHVRLPWDTHLGEPSGAGWHGESGNTRRLRPSSRRKP